MVTVHVSAPQQAPFQAIHQPGKGFLLPDEDTVSNTLHVAVMGAIGWPFDRREPGGRRHQVTATLEAAPLDSTSARRGFALWDLTVCAFLGQAAASSPTSEVPGATRVRRGNGRKGLGRLSPNGQANDETARNFPELLQILCMSRA